MTNFEKIKAMSLNELADFICELFTDCTEKCPGYDFCKYGYRGTRGYLQQEAKEE